MPLTTVSHKTEQTKEGVWLIYDGDCPICTTMTHALQIKKTVGHLHLVNARENREHPLLKEVNDRRLNLDEGMVLKYQNRYYLGKDALHMMALLGSAQGWFNQINAALFRSKSLARFCYPVMRTSRNTLLRLRGVRKIRNLENGPKEPLS